MTSEKTRNNIKRKIKHKIIKELYGELTLCFQNIYPKFDGNYEVIYYFYCEKETDSKGDYRVGTLSVIEPLPPAPPKFKVSKHARIRVCHSAMKKLFTKHTKIESLYLRRCFKNGYFSYDEPQK